MISKSQLAFPKAWHLAGPHKFTWLRAGHRVSHPSGYTLTDPEGYERAYFGSLQDILQEMQTTLANHGEKLVVIPADVSGQMAPVVKATLAEMEAHMEKTKGLNIGEYSGLNA